MTRILFLVFLLYQSVESLWPYHISPVLSEPVREVRAKSWILRDAKTDEAVPSQNVMLGFLGSINEDEILNGETYFLNKKLKGWLFADQIEGGDMLGFKSERNSMDLSTPYYAQTTQCMHGNVFVQRKKQISTGEFEITSVPDSDDQLDSDLSTMFSSSYDSDDMRVVADELMSKYIPAVKTHQTCWPAHASHLHVRDNYHLGPVCSSNQYYATSSASCETCPGSTVPDWSSSVLQTKFGNIQYFDTTECESMSGWEKLVSRFDWTKLANPENYYYCKEIVDTLGFMGLHGGDGFNENYQVRDQLRECIFKQCGSAIYSNLDQIRFTTPWSFHAPHPGYFWPFSPINCKPRSTPLTPTTRGNCGDNGLVDAVEYKDFVGEKTCQESAAGEMPDGIRRIHPKYTWKVPTYTDGSKYRLLLDELWFQGPDTSELTFDTDDQVYRRSYCFDMKRDGECMRIIEETLPHVYPNETIYVSSGDIFEGAYSFYSDTECQNTLFLGQMESYRLAPRTTYTFRRCNNSNTHPFEVSIDDTWSGDGIVGNETLVFTTGGLHRVYEWRSSDFSEFIHGIFIVGNHSTMLPGGRLLTTLGSFECSDSVETDLVSNTASKNFSNVQVEDKRNRQLGGLLLAAIATPGVNYSIVAQRLRQVNDTSTLDMPFEEECAYNCENLNKLLSSVDIDSSGVRRCSCTSGKVCSEDTTCSPTCKTSVLEDTVYTGTFDNTWKSGSGYGGLQEFVGFFTPENCEISVSDLRYNNPDEYGDVNGVSSDGHRCYMEYNMKGHDKSVRFKSKFLTDIIVNVGEIIPSNVTYSRVSDSNLYARLESTGANSFNVFEDDMTFPVYNFSANFDEYTIGNANVAIELLDTRSALANTEEIYSRRVLALGVNYLGTDPFASLHLIELDQNSVPVRSLCLAGFMNKEIQEVHSVAVLVLSQTDEYLIVGESADNTIIQDTEREEQIKRFSESEDVYDMNSFKGSLVEDLPKEDRGFLIASVLHADGSTKLWATDIRGIPLDNQSPFIDSVDFEWSLYAVHRESVLGARLLMAVYDEEKRQVYIFDNEFSMDEEFRVEKDIGIVSDTTGSRYPEPSAAAINLFDPIIGMEWTSDGKLIVMTDKDVHMYTRKRENMGLVPCQIEKTTEEIAKSVSPGLKFELDDKCEIVTEKCPSGQYQDEAGQYDCKFCLPGTYNDAVGQKECKDCWIGTFQPHHGQEDCDDCMPGFYSDEEGSHGLSGNEHESIIFEHTCKSCPKGYMSMEKASPLCIKCKSEHHCDIKSQIISHATCTPGNDIWLDETDHLHELCCSTSMGQDVGYDRNKTLFGWRETDALFCTRRRKINAAPVLENCGSIEDKSLDELDEFFNCTERNYAKEISPYGYLIPSNIYLPDATESNTTDTSPIGTEWAGSFECFMETDHPTDIITELNECCPGVLNDIVWQQGDDLRCVKMYGGDYLMGFDSKSLSLNISSETKTEKSCQITVNSAPTNFHPLSDEFRRCCNADVGTDIMLEWGLSDVVNPLEQGTMRLSDAVNPFQQGSTKCYKSTDGDDCYLEFEYTILDTEDETGQTEIEITYGTCEDNGYKVPSAKIIRNSPGNCSEGWVFEKYVGLEYEYSNELVCPEGWEAVDESLKMAIFNGSCTDRDGWKPVLVKNCEIDMVYEFPAEYMEISNTYMDDDQFKEYTCRAQKFNRPGEGQEQCFFYNSDKICEVIPIPKNDQEIQDILDTECSNEYPCLCQRPVTCKKRDDICSFSNQCECSYTQSPNCTVKSGFKEVGNTITNLECGDQIRVYGRNYVGGYITNPGSSYAEKLQYCEEACRDQKDSVNILILGQTWSEPAQGFIVDEDGETCDCVITLPSTCVSNCFTCKHPAFDLLGTHEKCYCDDYETVSVYTTRNHKTQHNKSKTYFLADQWDAKDFDLVQGYDQVSDELYVIEQTWSNVSVNPTILSQDGSIFHDNQYYYDIEVYYTNDVLIDMKGGVDWESTRGADEFRYCRHEFDTGEKRLVNVTVLNVTVFENSSDINSTLINATESVPVYDSIYCSSFFPIAKKVSQYEWTCSSVSKCPYWEYWPRPIDSESGFVETDPCICNDKEEYSGYCIPDQEKWTDVIVNSTTNETMRMLMTQELWVTDVDQLFVNTSLREFRRSCTVGNIMKSSIEYNKSGVFWWQDALDRSCMCKNQLCNAYEAHEITFGGRDLDPNTQMLTHTCASDGCVYDILDPAVWQDTEGYSEDCSNATDTVCGVYGFGRYNDRMDYQMLFGLYDPEGKVKSGIMKCPNVDASHRNVFGSKEGIYVRDGDFDVAPNGLPAYCKCGSDYCNYGEYCKVYNGNGYCGDSSAHVLDTVFRNNVNVQCSCLPNTIEDLDLSDFKAEDICSCNNSTYCGQGDYCSKEKGCVECACNEGEWEELIDGKSSCKPVSNCELGWVIQTPETQYSDRTCEPCVETLTYAPYPNANKCVPCTACAAGIKTDCNLTSDTVCKRVCPLGQHDWYGFCMDICSPTEHTLANGTCIDTCDYGTYFNVSKSACVQCPENHFTTITGAETNFKCRPHTKCNTTSHYWAELPSKSRKGKCVPRYSGECVVRTPGTETTDDQCNMPRTILRDNLIESDAMQKNLSTNNNYELHYGADLRIVQEILETEYYWDNPSDIQLASVGRYLSLFGEATYFRPTTKFVDTKIDQATYRIFKYVDDAFLEAYGDFQAEYTPGVHGALDVISFTQHENVIPFSPPSSWPFICTSSSTAPYNTTDTIYRCVRNN